MSTTGLLLVAIVGETVIFVYMVVAGLQLVMVGEKVVVCMVVVCMVVVMTTLVYPEQLVCPVGVC